MTSYRKMIRNQAKVPPGELKEKLEILREYGSEFNKGFERQRAKERQEKNEKRNRSSEESRN